MNLHSYAGNRTTFTRFCYILKTVKNVVLPEYTKIAEFRISDWKFDATNLFEGFVIKKLDFDDKEILSN